MKHGCNLISDLQLFSASKFFLPAYGTMANERYNLYKSTMNARWRDIVSHLDRYRFIKRRLFSSRVGRDRTNVRSNGVVSIVPTS